MLRILLCLALCLALPAQAATYAEARDKRPELFDPDTGYRIGRQRAPTPSDIPPPAQLVDTDSAAALIAEGALVLDVFGAAQSRFDELDGTWLVSKERLSLPGALWLPETGRGRLSPTMQAYLETNLAAAMDGQPDRPIVVFCIADCWMSWNAAQRISDLGYGAVYWFRLGTDGWLDEGRRLVPATPVPVNVD
ncbi:rhodanese-like domain-containing protein [Dinoroseobacter sp. S375]|uniref:rhodanese-like domain-containing protein n=1 Tax=Dinoroseobacter sp. S375 TaxID=3415136 RepID=UPI003C7D9B7C